MNISIDCFAISDAGAANHVREQVFGREWRVALPSLNEYGPDRQLTFVARDGSTQEPIAALTAVETTEDAELHKRLGLLLKKGQRAARYTQLAVLKGYRGMNLPVQLILEARRRFVDPREIHCSWLLFDAKRAKSSSLCNRLGFSASRRRYLTEYGYSRVLTRDETSSRARVCDRRIQQWLDEGRKDEMAEGSSDSLLPYAGLYTAGKEASNAQRTNL